MKTLFQPLFLASLFIAAPVLAEEGTFTKLDFNACKTIEEMDGGVVYSCPGLSGNPITYKEGDLRASVFYGPLNADYMNEAFETFSAFNSVNSTVEWRFENKRPIAAILRFFISNPDPQTGEANDKYKGQVLVVSKIAGPKTGKSCVVGMVDALSEPDANEKAHQVAEYVAPVFICGVNKPRYFGQRGDLAPDLTSSLPARKK